MESKSYPEIPTCTICLEEMTNELSVTKCGHVYHTHCIEQSLEVRSSCPNCKTRIIPCQVHTLIYTIGNVGAGRNMHLKFLEELSNEDQKEFTRLLDKNEDLFKENNKLKSENGNLKKELLDVKNQNVELDKKFNDINQEKEKIQKDIDIFKNKKKAMKLEKQTIELEKNELLIKVTALENEQKEYASLKKLKMKMMEEEDESIRVIREKWSIPEQAKHFYEIVLMKKSEIKGVKRELENIRNEIKTLRKFQIYYEDKNQECDRLKQDLTRQKELTEKYKSQLKAKNEKNSNGEKSNKVNENSNSNFELFEDIENINISNKNFTQKIENPNKINTQDFFVVNEDEFDMNLLIEKPENESKTILSFDQNKPSLKKDLNLKMNIKPKNSLANAVSSHGANIFTKNENSPTKRLKIGNKHNFMQTVMQNSFTQHSQQLNIRAFLGKK